MGNLVDLLIHSATAEKDLSFLVSEAETITYGAALDRALAMACYLQSKGIDGENVLVLAEQRPETVLSFFGIAASNNAYVPIDPEQVEAKLSSIIKTADIHYQLCLGDSSLPGLNPIRYADAIAYKPSDAEIRSLFKKHDEDTKAYIVFTSGSTGKPKGVAKSHKAMLAFVESFLLRFPLAHERMCNQSPFYFDASMKDIYLAVASRSTLFIPGKQKFALPTSIMEYLQANDITYLCWVPSALTLLAKVRILKYYPLPSLKYVFFVGEVFAAKYLNAWRQAYPQATFVNIYGSSEIAGVCLYYVITKPFEPEQPIPLGRPLPYNEVVLEDGEIVIRSDQIALGYLADPERNAVTFVQKDGKTYLHSGDYGYLDEHGEIVFTSRKDFQIKHMGHRIELQEIELAFLSLPYVEACCCLLDERTDRIVLFVESSDAEADEKRVLLDGENLLAPYMRPNRVILLPSLPLTPNGKVDRVALKNEINR